MDIEALATVLLQLDRAEDRNMDVSDGHKRAIAEDSYLGNTYENSYLNHEHSPHYGITEEVYNYVANLHLPTIYHKINHET